MNVIGETISRYKIVEQIGSGGMGVVFSADDPDLGRRVAIKLLETAKDEPIYRARFVREAKAISSLQHPNIATVYDYGETTSGRPFLVMELVEGKTLTQVLDAGESTISEVIEVLIGVAEALAAAHAKGIIHRDIKPSNIMVSNSGQVKVLDFGLAKQMVEHAGEGNGDGAVHPPTQSGIVVGTPLYLSPEQATSRPIDGRSDLFSLGAVMYECVAGRQPFYGRNALEIGAQVIHVDPPPPSSVNPAVAPELDRIAMKALSKDPASRYQTAMEFAADLRQARNSLDGSQGLAPRPERAHTGNTTFTRLMDLTQTITRQRISLWMVIVAAVLIGAVVWGVQRYFRRPLHQPKPDAVALVERGTALLRNGENQRARNLFEQAIGIDQEYAIAHARLAEVLVDLDASDLASRELLLANQLIPDRTALPRAEALYIESLSASITNNNYASAVNAYQEIVKLNPNDAKAQVDLGRAYEKSYETGAAIGAYRRATEIDPNYPTAYLRLGILYTRRRDLASASDVFDRAEELFKQGAGNREGQTEVLEKRGLLYRENARSAEALEQFKKALALSRETGNVSQQIYALLDISSAQFMLGDAAAAENSAREAKDLAERNDLRTLVINGLISLGRVQTSNRDAVAAERNLLQARDLARTYNAKYREQSAILNLAVLRVIQGKLEEGLRLAQGALEFFDHVNYRSSVSACLTIIGRAERQLGNYEVALQNFERRLKIEQDADNRYEIGATQGDIGSVLVEMERFPEALAHYDQNYEILKTEGLVRTLGYSQGNRAEMLWRLGRYDDAAVAWTEVFKIAKDPKTADDALAAENLRAQAEMEMSRSNPAAAKKLVAPVVSGTEDDSSAIFIRAQIVDGLAKSRAGSPAVGIEEGRRALANATNAANVPLITYARLLLAESLYLGGKMGEAAELAKQVGESSAGSNRFETEWRAWLLAAIANESLGDHVLADAQRARSSAALSQLQSIWGDAAFNGYRTRPDIQASIKLLGGAVPAVLTSK
jgi:tetratricopeptide (TPR) repeat protein/predicted Ser/Thr protein kinase